MKSLLPMSLLGLMLTLGAGVASARKGYFPGPRNNAGVPKLAQREPFVLKGRPPCSWGRGYRNAIPGLVPGFIDTHATYWPYGFDMTDQNASKTIRFSGQFPYARYMSLIAYNETGNTVAQLFDYQIAPSLASQNPYQPGIDRATPNRSYEVFLVREGSSRAGQPNTLVIPARVKTVVVLLRVYLPDQGRSVDGGAGLPQIQAFDTVSGQPTTCPDYRYPLPAGTFRQVDVEPYTQGATINSYRITGSEYQPNGSNPYLALALRPSPSFVAVLQYRVPTTPQTSQGGGTFTSSHQVRYWSICLGNAATSSVTSCLNDEEAFTSADGWLTVAIGAESLSRVARARGLNFIPVRRWNGKPVLIFRQIMPSPNYAYPFSKVPPVDISNPTPEISEQFRASRYIGDYAPQGRYCDIQSFLNGNCL